MPSRTRSGLTAEEALITEYINSCVQFKTNVRFTDIATLTDTGSLARNILLIGPAQELRQESVKALPFYCPPVAAAIARLTEGTGEKDKDDDGSASGSTTVLAQLPGQDAYSTITVCTLPTKASRTNCPYRADVVTSAVSAAAGLALETLPKKNKDNSPSNNNEEPHTQLDIFLRVPAGAEVAMANAVARAAPHSFSAKSGNAKKAFLFQPITHNVIFAARDIFTAHTAEAAAAVPTVQELEIQCSAVQLCQRLVDTPTNILDTIVFAEIAQAYASQLGVELQIIKGEELEEKGYGGMYGVGKGAQYPPHLVTLRYRHPAASSSASSSSMKSVALVGKGIVYDCGGLALKPADFMSNMKTDMGGAAAVFCAFVAVVRAMQASPQRPGRYGNLGNLSVTLCLAENAIGPQSYRNDDILVLKSGKTVEVMNTDAEGRIVLADGVFHASNEQDFVPDVLLDMATLTGAQGIATGEHHGAIYVNEDAAEAAMLRAGRQCGDTCFPVVYCPEYHAAQYKSPHADLRNIMAVRTDAGVSCGGYFVECNLAKRFKGAFVHVDIAFPSSTKTGGTGYGVSLITEYCKSL